MKFNDAWAGLVLALCLTAAPLGAQQQTAPPAVPDSVQALVSEFQDIRQRLATVQDSALQADPTLVQAQQEIQAFVQAKVAEEAPGVQADMQRMAALQQEAAQAQAAQDTARIREIVQEGTRLQQAIEAAQAAALEREDVQARVEAFEQRMVDAMVEIDPEVAQALTRMEEIAGRLQAIQEGG